ncbi:hypothetical protein Mapa_006971 [Marchantia paleacea]|nr:hypothetical protein Mapa_006971 [Marchantia paleacea]
MMDISVYRHINCDSQISIHNKVRLFFQVGTVDQSNIYIQYKPSEGILIASENYMQPTSKKHAHCDSLSEIADSHKTFINLFRLDQSKLIRMRRKISQ